MGEFFESYFYKKPLLIKNRHQNKTQFLSWDDISYMLHHPYFYSNSASNIITIGNNKHYSESTAGLFSAEEQINANQRIKHHISKGNTIYIPGINNWNEEILDFVTSLEEALGGCSSCHLFFSQPQLPSFGIHTDNTHVFIYMVKGKKHWKVFKEFSNKLVDRLYQGDPDDLTIEIDEVLEEGDFLYLPPRIYHEAVSVTPSLLLSISERKLNAQELITCLFNYSQNNNLHELFSEINHLDKPETIKNNINKSFSLLNKVMETNDLANMCQQYVSTKKTRQAIINKVNCNYIEPLEDITGYIQNFKE